MLVEKLQATERELHELTGGELAVLASGGARLYLPSEVHEKLQAHAGALELAADMQRGILNALPAHIALLRNDGVIVAVNESWRRFGSANVLRSEDFSVGQNYLTVCDRAQGDCSDEAAAAAEGIRRVLRGEAPEFSLEYPCHSPTEKRWFRLMVTPVGPDRASGAIVMHVNVTQRRLAEEAIREQEVAQRSLAEQLTIETLRLHQSQAVANVGSWETDATKLDVVWTPETFRIFETTPEQFQPTPAGFLEFVHPDDRQNVGDAFARSLGQLGSFSLEHRLLLPGGKIKHVEERWYNVNDAAGKTLRTVGTCQDITARKLAEMALRDSEEQFKAFFERANVGMSITEISGKTLGNQALGDMLGLSPAELRQVTWQAVTHPDDAQATQRKIETLVSGREHSVRFIKRFLHKNSSVVWADLSSTLRRDTAGQPLYLMSTLVDITERKQAEERLRESEAKLRVLFDTMAEGLALNEIVYDDKGEMVDYRILEVNRAYFSVADRASDHVIGGLATELYGMSTDAIKAFWRSHKDRTESIQAEMVSPLNQRSFLISTSPILNHRFITSFIDITGRKQANDALRASEARFRAIIDISPVPIAMNDEGQRVTLLNAAFIASFGYTKDDLQTLSEWWPLAYPDPDYRRWVVEAWQAELERAKRAGVSFTPIEVTIRCKDGANKTVLASAASVGENWGGEHLVLLYDITARKQSEQALLLRSAALEAAANAIVITGREGIIEWANPAFTTLSGWTPTDALGKNPRDLVKSGQHDAAFYRQMWETILAGKVWQGEIVNRRKDGALRTENMTITPLRDAKGEISHFIAIKQDITEQKTMETRFLQGQRMEAIGALAGGIAHDLNNVLSPIMMLTGLLKDKLTDESDLELLAMAQTSAQRGANIIKQLMTYSRGQESERVQIQPRHLIHEMIGMMRETFPRDLDIQQRLPVSLWKVLVDPTQLHQVLMNLCVNARDAMPTGGRLAIEAANISLADGDSKLAAGAKPGPYVMISVSDTGHGIPAEIRHRIFDPFFTTKPLGKGTGLGLSTVFAIMQHHGGFVVVDSTPQVGTTFMVGLPATTDGVEAAEVPLVPVSLPKVGQTILVVDDERIIRDGIRLTLEHQHFQVMMAVDGADALTQFVAHRANISLVLTDLMMPVMNGVTLARALRAINPAVAIAVMSGMVEVDNARELVALGIPDVLAKPFTTETLLETVHRRLTGA